MTTPVVEVYADPAAVAATAAARLLARLAEAQAGHGSASVVLTGGRSGAAVLAAVRDSPDRDRVDWHRVNVWWGDERFLPTGHPDRNDTQARAALLDAIPLNPTRVHPMPASGGPDGDDVEAAAARYADALAAVTSFDVLLLGVGEDGHVASLFPGHPDRSGGRWVSAVRDSPKPPPVRLTLTREAISVADEVWLFATGAEKAHAVGQALAGADLPAASVRGQDRTVWMLDSAAATELPARP